MTVKNYLTAEIIRSATIEEWAASILASARDSGAGVIKVDGQLVYVAGEPAGLDRKIDQMVHTSSEADAGAGLYADRRDALLTFARSVVEESTP